jgi:hypothetical protein
MWRKKFEGRLIENCQHFCPVATEIAVCDRIVGCSCVHRSMRLDHRQACHSCCLSQMMIHYAGTKK